MTMTIVGYDPRTGQFGGAVATKNIAVGARVLKGKGEVGMVGFSSTETHRLRALRMLELGFPAPVIIDAIKAICQGRGQYSIIDRHGVSAAYTTSTCFPWAGSRAGKNYACGANTMVGPEVVQGLGDTFEKTENSSLPLHERLLQCLEAAQATGGDNRGRQSAAIRVFSSRIDPDTAIDLRVDDHPTPIPELRSIIHIYLQTYPGSWSTNRPPMASTEEQGAYPILYH